jgi:hypothetical protein
MQTIGEVRIRPAATEGWSCWIIPSSLGDDRRTRRPELEIVGRIPKGFSYFVTSIAAPATSGWSVRRVGLAPPGKRRLSTAHTHCGH